MKLPAALAGRVFDLIDALFDAVAAILRVLIRGTFAPDARSYRAARFAPLAANELLVQDLQLNASDVAEARRIVGLDPERHLPLAADTIAFDLAGPIDAEGVRTRPERRFVLGVARHDALAAARARLPAGRRGAVEAFVHAPAAHPAHMLVFVDAPGKQRRRLRRALVGVGLTAFLWAGADAWRAWSGALERGALEASETRLLAERRLRLAERRATQAEATLAALAPGDAVPLDQAVARIARWAARQPENSETTQLSLARDALTLRGQSFDAAATELELRRGFEDAAIGFVVEAGDAPSGFEARITPNTPERAP